MNGDELFASISAARRDFGDEEPGWSLKPEETVCSTCWLVQPCDCEATL